MPKPLFILCSLSSFAYCVCRLIKLCHVSCFCGIYCSRSGNDDRLKVLDLHLLREYCNFQLSTVPKIHVYYTNFFFWLKFQCLKYCLSGLHTEENVNDFTVMSVNGNEVVQTRLPWLSVWWMVIVHFALIPLPFPLVSFSAWRNPILWHVCWYKQMAISSAYSSSCQQQILSSHTLSFLAVMLCLYLVQYKQINSFRFWTNGVHHISVMGRLVRVFVLVIAKNSSKWFLEVFQLKIRVVSV